MADRLAPLEALLLRDRAQVLAGLILAIALSWLYLVPAASDMYGDMDGLSRWMMQADWSLRYAVLTFLMWGAMMTGMMLPSAAPAILLYARVHGAGPVSRTYVFVAGYLAAWLLFSLGATLVQWQLSEASLLSPMLEPTRRALGASLLIVAGVYQWTAMKRACLEQCRSPAEFLTRHFKPGLSGAFQLGLRHGLYCVGCCWALMLLLFAGGVMNLLWIAAITVFVLLEKLAPAGVAGGKLSGIALTVAGVALLAL